MCPEVDQRTTGPGYPEKKGADVPHPQQRLFKLFLTPHIRATERPRARTKGKIREEYTEPKSPRPVSTYKQLGGESRTKRHVTRATLAKEIQYLRTLPQSVANW